MQLLIDHVRYARLEQESRASGRSVSAIIRLAIDAYFDGDAERRAAAAERVLAHPVSEGTEPVWADSKTAIEARAEQGERA